MNEDPLIAELIKACDLMLPYFEGSAGATEENVRWVQEVIVRAVNVQAEIHDDSL